VKHFFQDTNRISSIFSSYKPFIAVQKRLKLNPDRISISGINSTAQLGVFVASLRKNSSSSYLIVFHNPEELETFLGDLEAFTSSDSIAIIPEINITTEDHSSQKINEFLLNDAIHKIVNKNAKIIITTINALNETFPDYDEYKESVFRIKTGSCLSREQLLEKLESLQYSREFIVEYPGEYSVRGDIVDIYPTGNQQPYRIEFFDDIVESIRIFNVSSQETILKSKTMDLFPNIISNVDYCGSLVDYLPENSIIVLTHSDTHTEDIRTAFQDNVLSTFYTTIYLNDFVSSDINFVFNSPVLKIKGLESLHKHINSLNINDMGRNIFLFCSDEGQKDRLSLLVKEKGVIYIGAHLSTSFEIPEIGLFIYSDLEIFSKRQKPRSFSFLPAGIEHTKINPSEIQYNDLVVHLDYGIGSYIGLKKVSAFGATRECLVLAFQGGDNVLVPLEKMSLVHKYHATGGFVPKISKLGGGEWDRIKLRTRRSIEELSDEIIDLYSRRMQTSGFSYSKDSEFQMNMEAEFAFEETVDQSHVIDEIKADMETSTPMDRLLCGDVGFGKTEVAIRAAFKAVSDSKQVAILTPTTILADQHYISFKKRLEKYPISIGLLSRFVKKPQQKQTIKKLSDGTIDIVIGTHRLLSSDIQFSDLGLLIIDEEHRFGVKDKDKIKKYRTDIDVLSLSATPIPRSLHFSLIGARDFSLINTPPKERLPVLTEIISFDKNIIKNSVYHEINRSGQVFFVHNEVKTIASITLTLQKMFPDLIIRFIHGQMSETLIEPIMLDFMNNKINILVTTAIIESGIDIPNANTIFINKAQNLGLSQLYQLRGRVGRLNRQAYAYLIVSSLTHLNPTAVKRLQTIKRHTALGSGYSIALEDLEIRGAGNVFGLEQSGNIHAIGYDLYVKILQDALSEKKEKFDTDVVVAKTAPVEDVNITFPFPAFFPEDYISSESLRLKYYKSLVSLKTFEEVVSLQANIIDIFGRLPEEVNNLFDLITIKLYCSHIGIKKLILKNDRYHLIFSENHAFQDSFTLISALKTLSSNLSLSYKFVPSDSLLFVLYLRKGKNIDLIKQFLYHLGGKLNLQGNL